MSRSSAFLSGAMRGAAILFLLVAMTVLTFAQDLILNGDQTVGGTINVNRNVINNTAGAVTISGAGRIQLTGAPTGAAPSHSVQGGTGITFARLDLRGSRPTTLAVATAVTTRLGIGFSAAYTAAGNGFNIDTQTLSIGGTSSYDNASSAALTFLGGTVAYNSGSPQVILNNAGGVAYGTLDLSGAGAKTIGTGAAASAVTLTQAGGALGVTEDLNVSTSATIASLGDITAGKVLQFTTTATGTVTAMNNTATGTLRKAGTAGTVTVATLTGNAGTIDVSGTGTSKVAFTNNITNTGTIQANTGALEFNGTGTQTNTGGTIQVTAGGTALFMGDIAANPGTLTFNSASSVTYGGAAQNIAPVTYGTLVAGGTGAKTAASAFTVAGNLTLDQNITQSSGALTLTSTTAANVTGTAEVIGSVRRNHSFTAAGDYRFNRADVTMAFDATAAGDVTLTMDPATNPTNAATNFARYVSRNYSIAPTTPPGNLSKLQLYYASAGDLVNVVSEAKLGARYTADNGTTWSKLLGTGAYRTSGSNLVTLTNLSQSLAGVDEFAVAGINFISAADGANLSTALGAGFDENAFPDATDDVIIRNIGVTVGTTALSIGTLTIEGGKALTADAAGTITVATTTAIDGSLTLTGASANLAATTVGSAGSVSVANTRTLTATTFTNNSSSASTFTGNASLTSLVNNGTGILNFNGSGSAITTSVTNVAGATISVGGTLDILTAGAATLNSAGNVTVAGASGILNVGVTTIASNLTMANGSTLTVDDALGQLNVFGNLELGATAALSNAGTITVGE